MQVPRASQLRSAGQTFEPVAIAIALREVGLADSVPRIAAPNDLLMVQVVAPVQLVPVILIPVNACLVLFLWGGKSWK
jgi:hypothetical protein